jgi:hypothetical protein
MSEAPRRENVLGDQPTPSRAFADGLRDHLRRLDAAARRPPHLWMMVAAYAGAGFVLLILAAAGVAS